MKITLTVLAVAFVSAFIPVVNIETYVVVMAAMDTSQIFLLAGAATVGQMAGKYIWYEVGRNSERWPWLQKKLSKPKIAARMERWTEWSRNHSSISGLVLFASACAGLPPFLVMSIVAGRLKVHRAVFLVTGLTGRFARFLIAAGLMDWIQASMPA